MSMQLDWKVCQGNVWCSFMNVELDSIPEEGVYVIFQRNGAAIYVGQGNVAERIASHRRDASILEYDGIGQNELLITWANVEKRFRDGIEASLADYHRPVVGDAYPNAAMISVNPPF